MMPIFKQLMISIKAFLVLTILTGLIYPTFMTGLSQLIFPLEANGSLIYKENKIVGSALLAQEFKSPKYFQPRPSAGQYATIPSSGSQLSPTSKHLLEQVQSRKIQWGTDAPADLLTASASGLDPHISPEAALFQLPRIAHARGFTVTEQADISRLITEKTESLHWGILGAKRVNVLLLNLELDRYQTK